MPSHCPALLPARIAPPRPPRPRPPAVRRPRPASSSASSTLLRSSIFSPSSSPVLLLLLLLALPLAPAPVHASRAAYAPAPVVAPVVAPPTAPTAGARPVPPPAAAPPPLTSLHLQHHHDLSHAALDAGPLRALDNVGPALANATQTALTAGEQLITRYADVLRLVAIPSGLAIAFFGYFLLAPVLFISGFAVGGASCFVAVLAVFDAHSSATAWFAIAASLVGGALLAFLALHALPVGLFAAGASLGLVFASALRPAVLPHFFPANPRLAFIVAAALCGALFGMLALVVQKQMLIFSTAYGGAGAAAYGAGRFLRHFPSGGSVDDLVENGRFDAFLVLYAALAVGLGTAGMAFQSWLARDRPMHARAPREPRRRARLAGPLGSASSASSRRSRRRRRVPDDDWWDEDDDEWSNAAAIAGDDHRTRERVPLSVRKHHAVVPAAGRDLPTDAADALAAGAVVYLADGRPVRIDATQHGKIVGVADKPAEEGETTGKTGGEVADVV